MVLCFGLISAAGVSSLVWNFSQLEEFQEIEFEPPQVVAAEPVVQLLMETIPIGRGDTLGDLLTRWGVDPETRTDLISAIREEFDIRKIRAGSHFVLGRSLLGTVESLEYAIDPDRKLLLARADGAFVANVVEIPGTIRPVRICGTLQSSLFESIAKTGEQPDLAFQIADIFAWSLDFYTDPRQGDSFCLLVEKKEYGGARPPTYQRILAATYNNAGALHDAYLFPDEDGEPRYYSSSGKSLQASFLRSPLRFQARVSSHFSTRRFHPILKRYRPHLGIDYAAPAGTPVQAVASGQVVFSGRMGGAGNLVKLKHPGGYETQYLHLSRRLVRSGERVVQGQQIGLVGSTGLATGPHLDFRIRVNGRFRDFEGLKLPLGPEVPSDRMAGFQLARDRFSELMDESSPLATTMVAGSASPAASRSTP